MNAFRGTIFDLNPSGEALRMIDDGIVVVDEAGTIAVADSLDTLLHIHGVLRDRIASLGLYFDGQNTPHFQGKPLPSTRHAILPPNYNLHDHSFQPRGIHGPLITFDPAENKLKGWLPDTLREGELPASADPTLAKHIARAKLQEFAENGFGTVLQYTTSSRLAAQAVLEAGEDIGLRTVVGYVAMDQGIDPIVQGLQTDGDTALKETESLLKEFGAERIVVIDRFTLAVTSATRRKLAELSRRYGALYETHADESNTPGGEKSIQESMYGTPSMIDTLFADGVFRTGGRVGLSHVIHSLPEEIDRVSSAIARGCEVSVRACPQSNAQLGSHWSKDAEGRDVYVKFPLREWEKAGAILTMGTDQGAGLGANGYEEMLWERGRHPVEVRPSFQELLQYSTVNGARSLQLDPATLRITRGNPAEFAVVEMANTQEGFYTATRHHGDTEHTAGQTIVGGKREKNILALYVQGRRVK